MSTFDTVLGLMADFPRPAPRLIRLRHAAEYLCVSEWTLRQIAHKGEIQFIQRTEGGPILFDLRDLDEYIERAKQ